MVEGEGTEIDDDVLMGETTEDSVDDVFENGDDDIKEEDIGELKTEVSERKESKFEPIEKYVTEIYDPEKYEDQHVGLPSIYPTEYAQGLAMSEAWRKSLTGDAEEWVRILEESIGSAIMDEGLVSALEKGNWSSKIEHDTKELRAGEYDIGKSKNKALSGYNASIRTSIAMGGGIPYVVPLWHSGFHVTFTPASELEIIELQTRIENMIEDIGRSTYSALNSNNTVFVEKLLVEFALKHVVVTSKQTDGGLSITEDDILLNDLRPLIFGVMASIYPKGFPYARACIADASTCNHVEKGVLDLSELYLVNKDALSKKHLKHMTSTSKNSMSVKDIEEYQGSLGPLATRKIEVELENDTAIFYLKSPTIAERTRSGERWIKFLESEILSTLGKDYTEKQRKHLMLKRAISTNTRQYGHYVSKIRYKKTDYVIDGEKDIENALNMISTLDESRAQFTSQIIRYINDSTVAAVVIPVYDCTNCGKPQNVTTVDGERIEIIGSRNVIPIDVNQVFMKVVYGRTLLAQMR